MTVKTYTQTHNKRITVTGNLSRRMLPAQWPMNRSYSLSMMKWESSG